MTIKHNQILQGDCYDLIKLIPDKSIDLIITDPPYEIVGGGSGGAFGSDKRSYHDEYSKLSSNEHTKEGLKQEADKMICAGFDYNLLNELDRVMKRIYIYIYIAIRIKYLI